MAPDAMAPCVARTSATMALTIQNKQDLVTNGVGFRLPLRSYLYEMIENANI